jgi:hypothetical protein
MSSVRKMLGEVETYGGLGDTYGKQQKIPTRSMTCTRKIDPMLVDGHPLRADE